MASLMDQLHTLCREIGSCSNECNSCPTCPPQSCACAIPPQNVPFATVCMVIPPPILAPTAPNPVKPLQYPCIGKDTKLSQEEAEALRFANFYNNYNIDPIEFAENLKASNPYPNKCKGMTVDGSSPCCDLPKKCKPKKDEGCPTGFKPCLMKLCPHNGDHPCGIWTAEIQPCPPSAKIKAKKCQ